MFYDEISPNFNLKNMISTYPRNCHGKNDPNLPDLEEEKKVGNQKYRKILIFFPLSYLICSQIWLNHLMDDHHFDYITKLKKKKPYL